MSNSHTDGKSLEAEVIRIPAQRTLRIGLNKYTWTCISQEVTHGHQQAHIGDNLVLIVLHEANNGVYWIIDHMIDVPE